MRVLRAGPSSRSTMCGTSAARPAAPASAQPQTTSRSMASARSEAASSLTYAVRAALSRSVQVRSSAGLS